MQIVNFYLRFIRNVVADTAGQLLTGIGFLVLLGALVAKLWGIAAIGAALMIIGFLLFPKEWRMGVLPDMSRLRTAPDSHIERQSHRSGDRTKRRSL